MPVDRNPYAWHTVGRETKKKTKHAQGRIPGYWEQPGMYGIIFERPDKKECCQNTYKCYEECRLYHTPRQRECFRDPNWPRPTHENKRGFELNGTDPFPFLSEEESAMMLNIARSAEGRAPMYLHPNDKKDYVGNVYVGGQKANAPAGSKRKRQDTRTLSPAEQQRIISEQVAIGIRAARENEAAEAIRRADREADERAKRAETQDLLLRSKWNTVSAELTPEERKLIADRRRAENNALTSNIISSVDPTWSPEPVVPERPKMTAEQLNAKKYLVERQKRERAEAKAAEDAMKARKAKAAEEKKKDEDDEDKVDFDSD